MTAKTNWDLLEKMLTEKEMVKIENAYSDMDQDFSVDPLVTAINAMPSRLFKPLRQHPDDVAVDRLCEAMKAKMAAQRAKGYGGWDDPNACPVEYLQSELVRHVEKGDPVDVANFAMMLFARNSRTVAGE